MSLYIVAEIGVNHDGSVDKALKLIEKAVECGCNAVKFQSFKAERLVDRSAKKVEYQLRSGNNDESHFEMIQRLEFNSEKIKAAKDYADKLEIDFITTPYDPISLVESYQIGIRNFKTASADLSDIYIHSKLSRLDCENIIIATGMAGINSIERTSNLYTGSNKPIFLHCVSDYPCSDKSLNLLCLDLMSKAFPENRIGLSDHSIGETAALICAARGYDYFEKHFTLDKLDNGPDHYASVNVDEMKRYVYELKRVKEMMGQGIKSIQNEELGMSSRSKKAIRASRDIKSGEKLGLENTYGTRPAESGISIDNLHLLLGKTFSCNIKANDFIQWEMLK